MTNSQSLYLCHHGIMGMKWGVKNGPPYPLSAKAHSASEKKAGWRKSLKTSSGAPKSTRKGSTRRGSDENGNPVPESVWKNMDHAKEHSVSDSTMKKKHIAGIVASVAAIPLSVVGSAVLGSTTGFIPVALLATPVLSISAISKHARAIVNNSSATKRADQYAKEREQSPIDPKTGLRVKPKEMTIEQDILRVNPLHKDWHAQSKVNCALCSVTYDLRRRGYDVTAQGAGVGYYNEEIASWYNNKLSYSELKSKKKYDRSTQSFVIDPKDAYDMIAGDKAGERGLVGVKYPGGGGHEMSYDKSGGTVRIIDAQSGKIFEGEDGFKQVLKHVTDFEYARTDDLKINPKLMLKEVCKQ